VPSAGPTRTRPPSGWQTSSRRAAVHIQPEPRQEAGRRLRSCVPTTGSDITGQIALRLTGNRRPQTSDTECRIHVPATARTASAQCMYPIALSAPCLRRPFVSDIGLLDLSLWLVAGHGP
jgi:hypothetical protein